MSPIARSTALELFELIHETAVEGVGFRVVFVVFLLEFLHEFSLAAREMRRHFDDDSDEFVALAVAAQVGHADPAQA